MSRTFSDDNFLKWEAYPSGGDHGFSDNPYIIFNCLSSKTVRARVVDSKGDGADAERVLAKASAPELREMFRVSREIK